LTFFIWLGCGTRTDHEILLINSTYGVVGSPTKRTNSLYGSKTIDVDCMGSAFSGWPCSVQNSSLCKIVNLIDAFHGLQIKIQLRPDLAPKTVSLVKQLATRKAGSCKACTFYRHEPSPQVLGPEQG
jgi:hypothetical protein